MSNHSFTVAFQDSLAEHSLMTTDWFNGSNLSNKELIMKDNLQRVSGNSNQLNKLNRELKGDSNKLADSSKLVKWFNDSKCSTELQSWKEMQQFTIST